MVYFVVRQNDIIDITRCNYYLQTISNIV